MVEGDRTHAEGGAGDHDQPEPPGPDSAPDSTPDSTPVASAPAPPAAYAEPPAASDETPPAQTPPATPAGRTRRRWPARLVESLVLLLLVATALAYVTDAGDRWGLAPPDPVTEPQAVEPPQGLELPASAEARPPVPALAGGDLDRAAVARAVRRPAAAPRLGPRVAVVVGTASGRTIFRSGPPRMAPASTLKVLTAAAALEELGPERRFETSVVRQGRTLWLVGGGDPLLRRRPESGRYPAVQADLRTLARRTAQALGAGPGRLRLAYDTSLFAGPAVSPRWEPDYVLTDVVSPISALWVDQGREEGELGLRVEDPAAEAARVFRAELRRAGVRVSAPTPGPAATGAQEVATVTGAPLVQVVQHVLETSDNEGAEVLARQVALSRGGQGSFTGGAAAVRATLEGLGVDVAGLTAYDGSGLAREDRISPPTLLAVLGLSMDATHPDLEGVAAGLPVAGFSGSLGARFAVRADAGLGRVRAKTGTLSGIHGLAGVVVSRDGAVMTFAALADRVKEPNTLFARAQLDRIAAALAACRCRA